MVHATSVKPSTPISKPALPEKPSFNQILNEAIKTSTNPDVGKTKEEIDSIKKVRNEIISKIKENRRRLMYKEAESVAIARLLEIEKQKEQKAGEKGPKIGYLRRIKEKLEFRITTEARSLTEEKELVRKIEEINKQLAEMYRKAKMERKSEFVKKDIIEFREALAKYEAQIMEQDKRLDELYDKLRALLGIKRKEEKPIHAKPKRKSMPPSMQEINLEDIAVIKKKEKKAASDDEEIA